MLSLRKPSMFLNVCYHAIINSRESKVVCSPRVAHLELIEPSKTFLFRSVSVLNSHKVFIKKHGKGVLSLRPLSLSLFNA